VKTCGSAGPTASMATEQASPSRPAAEHMCKAASRVLNPTAAALRCSEDACCR
jgi:hypothetical protein